MWEYETLIHSHGLFWFITMILFGLTIVLLKSGKLKLAKVIQMSLRILYILLFVTGGALVLMNIWWGALLKGLLSFWLIYMMELISNRMAKNLLSKKDALLFWVQLIISFSAVLYMGYLV
ncbi:YisL family protein [Salipaludibacillus daqingensis]|uniref:YisL family protein n=1 Tax=Salipaludibacillus daqingensis TaxID=3041001 RepID=UPI0024734528|nr:YisL family protein [Salipaludibacillus daqingensis]